MKYFIRARRAKGREDRHMLPIGAQLAELRRYAGREDLSVAGEYAEAQTAKRPGRSVFNDMLSRIRRREADGIVSLRPDRLTGNPVDTRRITHLMMQDLLKELRFPHQRVYRSELLRSFWPGPAEAWRPSREVILEAVHKNGTILDVGCANGVLLRDLCLRAKEGGTDLVPPWDRYQRKTYWGGKEEDPSLPEELQGRRQKVLSDKDPVHLYLHVPERRRGPAEALEEISRHARIRRPVDHNVL